MNKIIPLAIAVSFFSASSMAENIIRATAPVSYKPSIKESWLPFEPAYTDWANLNSPKNCTNWDPLPSFISEGTSFTQTATDCQQDQTRSKQEREQEATSLAIRDKGSSVTESRTISASNTRNAIGTDATAPLTRYFTFVKGPVGSQYGCSGQSHCMSLPGESNMNGKSASYLTFGYGSAINFGLSGYSGNQLKAVLTKLRIELFDNNGVKYFTLTQVAPFYNQYGSYVGKPHTISDYNNASIAHKMRVSFELSE